MEKKKIISELHKCMDERDNLKRHDATMKAIAYDQNQKIEKQTQEIKNLKQQLEDLGIKYRDVMNDHTELLYRLTVELNKQEKKDEQTKH